MRYQQMHLVFGILVLALSLPLWAADDVAGKWKASAPGPDGQTMEIEFNFKVDGGKLTGNAAGPMGEMPISDGKVEDGRITFTVEAGDNKIVHKGTVSGDEMKLKVEFGERTMEMTARRVAS
jgi:hypothetical protein